MCGGGGGQVKLSVVSRGGDGGSLHFYYILMGCQRKFRKWISAPLNGSQPH